MTIDLGNQARETHPAHEEHTILETQKHLGWIDILRFACAFSVMIFHYCRNGIDNGKIENFHELGVVSQIAGYGVFGVDIFFVISGLVICIGAHEKTALSFARDRILRLYPTYLLCLAMTSTFLFLFGDAWSKFGIADFLANTTMMAGVLGFKNIDGVYWTLALELSYYFAMFSVLSLGAWHNARWIISAWVIFTFVAHILAFRAPLISGYFPLFALGASIWLCGSKSRALINYVLFAACLWVCVDGALGRATEELSKDNLMLGLASIYLAMLLLFACDIRMKPRKWVRYLGRMTYPLYLVHAYIGYHLISDLSRFIGQPLATTCVALVMIFISYLIYTQYEMRFQNYFKNRIDRLLSFPFLESRWPRRAGERQP